MPLNYMYYALSLFLFYNERKKPGQTEIAETENQSNFGLVGPMSVISSHAVLHTGVILTKRAHIVLTPM